MTDNKALSPALSREAEIEEAQHQALLALFDHMKRERSQAPSNPPPEKAK